MLKRIIPARSYNDRFHGVYLWLIQQNILSVMTLISHSRSLLTFNSGNITNYKIILSTFRDTKQ